MFFPLFFQVLVGHVLLGEAIWAYFRHSDQQKIKTIFKIPVIPGTMPTPYLT